MTIANISGGRDSSCMVVRYLELGNNIDYIIFCDTGYEFSEMYEYIDKLNTYLKKEFNKEITILDSSDIIEKYAFIKPISKGVYKDRLRGLPVTLRRDYCTRETKVYPSKKFVTEKSSNKYKNIALIGYTYNEVRNGRVSNLDYAVSKYPLYEWQYNHSEVDSFLKKRGIHNPLYNHFKRTGCYFCPKQSKQSLFMLYKHYPHYFKIMKEWEKRAKELNCVNQTWRIDNTLENIEKEFKEKLNNTENTLFNDEYITQGDSCFCLR